MAIQDRGERMRIILENALHPTSMIIIDDSHRHARHVERMAVLDKVKAPDKTGQTHYKMDITSSVFDGKSRVERHRLVQDILKTEFDTGLHALTLTLRGEQEK